MGRTSTRRQAAGSRQQGSSCNSCLPAAAAAKVVRSRSQPPVHGPAAIRMQQQQLTLLLDEGCE
jgi:hypothetical protein